LSKIFYEKKKKNFFVYSSLGTFEPLEESLNRKKKEKVKLKFLSPFFFLDFRKKNSQQKKSNSIGRRKKKCCQDNSKHHMQPTEK
jgi:uncharacterized membrane protein